MDTVYLDFTKTFNTAFHKIIVEKLMKYGLDEETVRWTEKHSFQRMVISDTVYLEVRN